MIQARPARSALLSSSASNQPTPIELDWERQHIAAAQQGNEQALTTLYETYVDSIYRYIFYRVDSPEVAQDLTSEVFLRVVEGLSGYQDRGLPFLAWLYRIAHARVVDHYRHPASAGESQDLAALELGVEDDADSSLMATYQQQQVRQALACLNDEQQQVVLCRFIDGYSLQETAENLGKTVGSVKVMQHRALRALHQLLKEG
jgi:RNA polymerase sigma-70 factor, ECF subfamily